MARVAVVARMARVAIGSRVAIGAMGSGVAVVARRAMGSRVAGTTRVHSVQPQLVSSVAELAVVPLNTTGDYRMIVKS